MRKHCRTQWGLGVAWPLFLSLLMGLFLSGCNEAPFEPKDDEPPKDYVFYLNDGADYPDNRYYAYHSATDKVDTFTLPYSSDHGLAASADGKRLYLATSDSTVVVDTDSFKVMTVIPYGAIGTVVVSPDNQMVAFLGDDLNILSTVDYSLIYHDTDRIYIGTFSSDSRCFYGTPGWDTNPFYKPHVYKVDLSDSLLSVTRKTFSEGAAWRVVPSINNSKWFLYMKYSECTYSFCVYDVQSDSIIYREILQPGAGDIEVTPDGRYVFYSNPGTTIICYPAPAFFTVFDIENNRTHKTIKTIIPPYPISTGHLIMTPDGRKVIAVGALGWGAIFVVNTLTMDIEKKIWLGDIYLWDVTCQNSP